MGGKETRLFLDANVLFSIAYDPESRSAAVLALARKEKVPTFSSPYAIEEARRNLELKRPESLSKLKQLLRSVRVAPEAPVGLVQEVAVRHGVPAADAPILATAIRAHAHLVTGDRSHFGHLMGRRHLHLPIQVLSLSGAIHLLLGNK